MFVLANDAVALFFVITGYFNFGADRKTLERRIKHLLRLYLVAILFTIAVGIITAGITGDGSAAFLIPRWDEIMNWLILQQDPRNGQLWYLTSACLCYLILYLYVRFFGDKPVNYRPLYYAAFSLCGLPRPGVPGRRGGNRRAVSAVPQRLFLRSAHVYPGHFPAGISGSYPHKF